MDPLFEYRTEAYTPHVAPQPPLVVLPSGRVVNLARVTFVTALSYDGRARIFLSDIDVQVWIGAADHAALIDAIDPMEDEEDDDAS